MLITFRAEIVPGTLANQESQDSFLTLMLDALIRRTHFSCQEVFY
jgi:hypothetical protein